MDGTVGLVEDGVRPTKVAEGRAAVSGVVLEGPQVSVDEQVDFLGQAQEPNGGGPATNGQDEDVHFPDSWKSIVVVR